MSEEALDELSVLSAIFCEKDEFELIEESVVSIYQKWSKEGTVVNRRQGHGRPWITDACGEGSLACVVRSNRRTPVAQIVEELNAVHAWQNRSNTILAQTGLVYRICTPIDTDSGRKTVNLTFHLPLLYPQTPPDISVTSSDFSRTHCQELKRAMLSKAHSLPPEPMVHHLVTWLQSNIAGLIRTPDCSNTAEREAEDMWMALLHLDHMRSKAKYIKLIEKWTSELGLVGRLFVGRPILILLQGTKESIKEYIHLQRTVKVDVDSSGKRCKEKMLRVLCEVPFTADFKRISTFEVKEDLSLDDLRREFDLVGSMKLYNEFVPLVQ